MVVVNKPGKQIFSNLLNVPPSYPFAQIFCRQMFFNNDGCLRRNESRCHENLEKIGIRVRGARWRMELNVPGFGGRERWKVVLCM